VGSQSGRYLIHTPAARGVRKVVRVALCCRFDSACPEEVTRASPTPDSPTKTNEAGRSAEASPLPVGFQGMLQGRNGAFGFLGACGYLYVL
jgi:hypothetical protein